MLYIYAEGIAFKKELEVAVVLQNRVSCRLAEHALEGGSTGLYEIGSKASYCLFFGRRWHDNPGIITVELVVEPEEVTIAS